MRKVKKAPYRKRIAKNKKRQKSHAYRQVGKIERGAIFVVVIMVTLMFAAYIFVGGTLPTKLPGINNNLVVVIPPTLKPAQSNLQLETFSGATVTPIPPPPSAGPTGQNGPMTNLCLDQTINNEPRILVGYSPASGQTVGATGQIKVWVSDENPPCIGTGEVANPTTGTITTPGNHTEKAPDGYLWEPALYIAPNLAESGGTPFFPDFIKGTYNNAAKVLGTCEGNIGSNSKPPSGPAIDPLPPGPPPDEPDYQDEYIWNVSKLGLSPGTYNAEFVVHDGDEDRGVGCVNITIQ